MNIPSVNYTDIPSRDRLDYQNQFVRLRSNDGYVNRTVASEYFSKCSLSSAMLKKLWELSDIDKDGRLSLEEFCVAMHVAKLLRNQKDTILKDAIPVISVEPRRSLTPTPMKSIPNHQDVLRRHSTLITSSTTIQSSWDMTTRANASRNASKYEINLDDFRKSGAEACTIFSNSAGTCKGLGGSRPGNHSFARVQEKHALRQKLEELLRERQEMVRQRDLVRRDLEKLFPENMRLSDRMSKISKDLAMEKKIAYKGRIPAPVDTNLSELRDACTKLEAERSNLENDLIAAAQERSEWQARRSPEPPDAAAFDKDILKQRERIRSLETNIKRNHSVEASLRNSAIERNKRLDAFKVSFSVILREHEGLLQEYEKKRGLLLNLIQEPVSAPAPESSVEQRRPSIKDSLFIAVVPFTGETPSELSLATGDMVKVLEKCEDGWWLGRDTTNHEGYFPANYVAPFGSTVVEIESSDLANPSTPVGNSSYDPEQPEAERVYAVALFSYVAQNADELSFDRDELLEILPKDGLDAGWLLAKNIASSQTGIVPSNYIHMTSSEAKKEEPVPSTDKFRERENAIRELVSTERGYLTDMRAVLEVFGPALKTVCTAEEHERLFGCWQDIIKYSTDLVRAFDSRSQNSSNGLSDTIGHLLCQYLPDTAPYIKFCGNQMKMSNLVQEKTSTDSRFADILARCSEDPRMGKMPLAASFVKPMQRLTKYPLLIKRIIDATTENHNDLPHLREALKKAELLCKQVNEGVRLQEISDRMVWLQHHVLLDGIASDLYFDSETNSRGHRTLIYSGSLIKSKTGRELVAFLFNDFFMLTTPPRPLVNSLGNFSFENRQWMSIMLRLYKKPLLLAHCKVIPLFEEGCFQVTLGSAVVLSFKATTKTECKNWISNLEKAAANWDTVEKRTKAPRKRTLTSASPIGCCRLIVEGGSELYVNPTKGYCDPYCKLSVGWQEFQTAVIENSSSPKWDASTSFVIHDLENDYLMLTVYDHNPFAPDGFMGTAKLRIRDLYNEAKSLKVPLVKKILLYQIESGEIVLRIDIQLFSNSK